MRYRQSLLKFADKYGVSPASPKYNKSRSYIYFWRSRWDGSLKSLRCQSRHPFHHLHQHTAEKLALIRYMRRKNPDLGISEFWVCLRKRGYSRTIARLYRVMRREGLLPVKPAAKPYKPKPYEPMTHPGERVQIDVECVQANKRASSLSIVSPEETNRNPRCLKPPPPLLASGTADPPLHAASGGKVERSHREDQKRFYKKRRFYSLADFGKQLSNHQINPNSRPMHPHHWVFPRDFLSSFPVQED